VEAKVVTGGWTGAERGGGADEVDGVEAENCGGLTNALKVGAAARAFGAGATGSVEGIC
jgi:hypothetical protein